MNVRYSLFLALFIVVAAITNACFLSTEPIEHLDLTLTLSSPRLHADTGIDVRIAAINRTTHTLEFKSWCAGVSYYIVAPADLEFGPSRSPGCIGPLIPPPTKVLGPGEGFIQEFRLYPRPRWSQGEQRLIRWPAGQYSIVGYLKDVRGNLVRETEPVEFEVVCRDPTWPEC